MTMAFKYQIALCPRPQDLLLITFNHMDTIKELVKDNPSLVNQINEAQRQLIEVKAHCRPPRTSLLLVSKGGVNILFHHV